MEVQNWTEISVAIDVKNVDIAANITNMVVPYGIYIEDYSHLEQESMEIAHIDLIDDDLLKKDRTKAIIHIYIDPEENPNEAIAFLTERFNSEKIDYDITISDCAFEDWVNNWKKYFHPMPIGEKLLIRPIWVDDYNADNRKIINIEPGLAFGTGTHSTTKLCLETLEKYIDENSTVLDVGCGSGILSIASLLLGAKSAIGVDIDEIAVKTAIQNGKENGFESPQYTVLEGNLTDKVNGKFNVVVANIVADIIIMFSENVGNFMTDDAVFITSGIIDSREDDVLAAFNKNNFEVLKRYEDNGWLVFVLKHNK